MKNFRLINFSRTIAAMFFLNEGILMGIETPDYKLLEKDQKIEIREYKSSLIAKTFVKDSYREASSTGFRRIASFIFGGNDEGKKISMTAPVMITESKNQDGHEIFFFMPKKYRLSELPQPNFDNVIVEKILLGKVAVIKFGGWATEKNISFYSKELMNYLESNNYLTAGNYMIAQYNSPWAIPPFRKNEILVKID